MVQMLLTPDYTVHIQPGCIIKYNYTSIIDIYIYIYNKSHRMAGTSLNFFNLFLKGNPLVGQGHINIIQNEG